jgi:hypothetical protein
MAIDGVVYSGKEVQLGIAQESTFGTAIADNGAFVQIAEFGTVSVDYGMFQDTSVKNRGRRQFDTRDDYITAKGGTRTITISDWTIRKTELAEFVYAVMQGVSEAAGTPYQKTFTAPATQPDFASDAGYFCTIGIKFPEEGYDLKFTSCICTELTLSADLTGGDGRLKGSATFISGFDHSMTSTFSGTWTVASTAYFDFNAPSAKSISGGDAVLYSFEVSLANGGKRIGCDSSGDCESYFLEEHMYEATIKSKYDETTADWFTNYDSGTQQDSSIAVGTGDTDGYCAFAMANSIVTGISHDTGSDFLVDLNLKCGYDGSDSPTVVIADAVDQAW